jgi:hypothetical protein
MRKEEGEEKGEGREGREWNGKELGGREEKGHWRRERVRIGGKGREGRWLGKAVSTG